jgi:hypothetical protein
LGRQEIIPATRGECISASVVCVLCVTRSGRLSVFLEADWRLRAVDPPIPCAVFVYNLIHTRSFSAEKCEKTRYMQRCPLHTYALSMYIYSSAAATQRAAFSLCAPLSPRAV